MRKRILVVEDDPPNRELLVEWLETHGYQALGASDLKEATAAVQAQIPDIVLLDVQLGREDGLVFVKWIREQPQFKRVPVIAVTADAMLRQRERMLHAGCNAFITKPVNFRILSEHLQFWLSRSARLADRAGSLDTR